MGDIERVRSEIKLNKHRKNNKRNNIKNKYMRYLYKFLILVVLTLFVMIMLKSNDKFKKKFYEYVYEKNFSFAKLNALYQDKFGSQIPFLDIAQDSSKQVFNESLEYRDKSDYKDGVKLKVSSNYMVPILESGLVVFIGEKEGYGNTVIIQQIDGVDVWYGNISNTSIKLYDYVEKGNLLGECSNELYLVFKKDGNRLDYENRI